MSGAWTDLENNLLVSDYFDMLRLDVLGRPYSKAEHRRNLVPLLNNRSQGSVEFKHQNVSAVLRGMGEDWIRGYKPAMNFQATLIDAVACYLAINRAWSSDLAVASKTARLRGILLGDAPARSCTDTEVRETVH